MVFNILKMISKLFLVQLVLLGFILEAADSQGSILANCCREGETVYRNRGSCSSVQKGGRGGSCGRVKGICCLRSLLQAQCEAGESRAGGGSCPNYSPNTEGGAMMKQCCDCCALAKELSDAGESCIAPSGFSETCTAVFNRCCTNPFSLSYSATMQMGDGITSGPNNWVVEDRCLSGSGGGCQHNCNDYGGSQVVCSCRNGYTLNSDGRTCSVSISNGNGRTTSRTQDHFNDCAVGFQRDKNGACEDINECDDDDDESNNGAGKKTSSRQASSSSRCPDNQICLNSIGSFECHCKNGFTWNSKTNECVDIDECLLLIDDCMETQRCLNAPGSYRCIRTIPCGTGYHLDSNTETCIDLDECRSNRHNCPATYTCRNTQGSFRCEQKVCPQDHYLDGASGTCILIQCPVGHRPTAKGKCQDMDECKEGIANCGEFQNCVNTPGSYRCEEQHNYCADGFKVDGNTGICVDVNECETGSHSCGTEQMCINTEGSYKCTCPSGYTYNEVSHHCEDVDECTRSEGGSVCSINGQCENTPGSFVCHCNPGFRLEADGRTCIDVDECTEGSATCEQRCINIPGSYTCICNRGYTLSVDGRTCEDIDECGVWSGAGSDLCMGGCINTPGSYTCRCPAGYVIKDDGRTCRDIDECAQGECSGNDRICVNTLGSFKCHRVNCPPNYVQDNKFKHVVQDGFTCKKTCNPTDVLCMANHTLSISYQFAALPTMKRVPKPIEVTRVRAENLDAAPFYVKYVMDRDNQDRFRVHQDKMIGIVQLKAPIEGPRTVKVRLHMNVYSRSNVLVGHNLAVIEVDVSKFRF